MQGGGIMAKKAKKNNLFLTLFVVSLIILTALVLVLVSLNMQQHSAKTNISLTADEIATGVIKKMNYTNLSPISKENISRYYEFPDDTVSDYAMYISGRSGTETEIACFKVISDEAMQKVTAVTNNYLNDKSSSLQPVSARLATHYPYIFVVVAQDCDTAVNAFETVLNEPPAEKTEAPPQASEEQLLHDMASSSPS